MKELLETGVSISLVYNEAADALVGRIKEYAVAVRENNETMSYGCLIWVKKGEFAAIRDAESYLAEQVTSKPDVVKHFKVSERGIAVALVKTNDSFTNVNNIKRFLTDLAGFLSLNFYQSCCCYCGNTEHLGIYLADGTVAQACSACGTNFTPIVKFDDESSEPASLTGFGTADPAAENTEAPAEENKPEQEEESAAEEEPAVEEAEVVPEEVPAAEQEAEEPAAEETVQKNPDSEYAVYEEAFRNVSLESAKAKPADQDDFNALLAEAAAAIASAPVVESAFDKIDLNANKEASFDSLVAEKKEEEEEPSLELQERKSSITAEEYKNQFSDLMPEEKTDDSEEKPFFAGRSEAQIRADQEEFAALMDSMKPDGESSPSGEPTHEEKMAAESKAAEGADYTGFMYDPSAEKEDEDPWKNERREVEHKDDDTSFNEFMIAEQEHDKVGQGELDIPEQAREIVGHDENVAVTEYADDSNEGEDIDVEEIESTTNKPTDTSGEQIEAKETPLEEDGSVPLINPNSAFAEVKPSSADGPDAVQPLDSRERIYSIESESNDKETEAPAGYADGEDPRAEQPARKEKVVMTAVNPNPIKPTAVNPNPVQPRQAPVSSAPAKVGKISFGSNVPLGIIGAVVLGAVGAFVWLWICTISGETDGALMGGRRLVSVLFALVSFAIAAGVFGGYRICGRELDKNGVIISSVITVIFDAVCIFVKNALGIQTFYEKSFGLKISLGEASDIAFSMLSSGGGGTLAFNFWMTLSIMVIILAVTIRFVTRKM